MAERRMFAKTIIDSDLFLDMPASTQLLYFHLAMRADDDGFVNSPKKIQRMIGCSDDDIRILISKQFIIPFESGIVVIKHWKIHNYLRSDRYNPSVRPEKNLIVLDENKVYQLSTDGIPHGVPVVDAGKVRLDKVSEDKDNMSGKPDSVCDSAGTLKKNKPSQSQLEDDFEECWKIYPKKEGKAEAKRAYLKFAGKDPDLKQKVISGIKNYIEEIRITGKTYQYIQKGSTYFRNEHWNDEYIVKENIENETNFRSRNPNDEPF